MFSKGATVYSNDPQQPKQKIFIKCVIKQYIIVNPHNRVNLSGYVGDEIKEEITITSIEEEVLKITEITSDIDDKIKYKLKTKKKGREYALEIKYRSDQNESVRGKIKLKTNNEKKPLLIINVYGRLKEEVSVGPKSISFGNIDTSKENFNTINFVKKIVLRDVRGNGLTIKKIKTSSDWITTETKTQREGKIFTIVVTLDKDKLPDGKFNEKIKIRTNYKREYLTVDIKGEVI